MSTPVEAPNSPAGPSSSYNFPPAPSHTNHHPPDIDPHQPDPHIQQLPPRLPSPSATELPASSSDESTFIGNSTPPRNDSFAIGDEHLHHEPYQNRLRKPSETTSASREKSPNRALECKEEDDYELEKVERQVSHAASQAASHDHYHGESLNLAHDPSVPVGDSGEPEGHGHGHHGPWRPRVHETNKFARLVKKIHASSVWIRYFTYIVPVALILLIPLLVGGLKYTNESVGGVKLMWFMVWLEVVWCTLWAARFISKAMPYPIGIVFSAFTNQYKKWQDMARQLELPATLFFWWIGIYCSFLPIMRGNHVDGKRDTKYWEKNANIVLLTLFIATILNLVEKIIIQLIAISFHQRTYADRIELNRFQIDSLTKMYKWVKVNDKDLGNQDETEKSTNASGAVTPRVVLQQAKMVGQQAFTKVGDVVGKIAGDFTGREVNKSTSPQQVVITLLATNEGSNVLARRLYRGFCRDGQENVTNEDLTVCFDSEEEAEAAFSMFDRDLNGDISVTEMELACGEIGRERKAVIKSLKVLDSVVGKLDDCFTFIVAVIVIIVFLTLISKSTAGVLTSASSSILALSWLFSGTAQEFLASLIFVFVKHPFDVGDRVDIYNTGLGTRDTFFVKEIALMYTEFKKLEGHIVQAPNSLLNTLFILNMRRSGGLAEGVPIVVKFGTTLDQLTDLRERMLEFVRSEKREYQPKILTEVRDIPDMHSVQMNVVFFYKSNWQNELVRLTRRNKFICALMCAVHELGIEGPNMRWPGQKPTAPVYLSGIQNMDPSGTSQAAGPAAPPLNTNHPHQPTPGTFASPIFPAQPSHPGGGIFPSVYGSLRSTRNNGEVDYSLGMKHLESMDDGGDIFDDEPRRGVLPSALRRVQEESEEDARSSVLGRSTSRRSKESNHSMWHRRPRGYSNTTMHGVHGLRPPGSPNSAMMRAGSSAGGGGFWSRRSHEVEQDVLPMTEQRRMEGERVGGKKAM